MEPNYFTCTLGQAAGLGIQQPHKNANALVDALAGECPDLPAVGFPQPGRTTKDDWSTLIFTFSDIRKARDHVATALLRDQKQALSKRRTVGLLCPSNPEFLFTWLALMRLGQAVLLIAPKCQPAAIASLCQTCEVDLLFYDDVYRGQACEAASLSSRSNDGQFSAAGLPFPEEPQMTSFVPQDLDHDSLPRVDVEENEIAYLHHTSGTSSGMPKPIPQTHRGGVGVLPFFKTGHAAATFTTTPLYHGGIADLFRAWTSKAHIWLFPGKRVPITASNILKSLDVAEQSQRETLCPAVRFFSSVPYVLQMMESDSRGLSCLEAMSVVGVGGAALPAEVGGKLVTSGVNLISRFGSAECGFLMSSHRDYEKDEGWQYLRVAPGAEQYLRFEPQADRNVSELVVLPGWPHMAKRNRNDGSFATSDLFAPHPSIPGAWRYHSRADSQLTLITGKKFDPAPLEASIATSHLLGDVLIFGNGKSYPGALLFRCKEAEETTDTELLEQVWPLVEKLNAESQDHARISKSMLVPMQLLPKPLEKSSKGTILRGAAEKRFQQAMEGAYNGGEDVNGVADVPDEQLSAAVRDIIESSVARAGNLTDDTELFGYGVDSVAGMQIRGKLRRLLPLDARQLPINVVEDCGNVTTLVEYIRRRRRGEADVVDDSAESEHHYMRQLVEENSNFSAGSTTGATSNGVAVEEQGEVVVLTGATGALGAHVLDQYRKKDNVRKIYCLVRGADNHASYERVSKALVQRKLQPLGNEDPNEKVVVFQASLGETDLGLDQATYGQISREATIIMHVAWSVNFRMKLRSFVKDNIAGTANLINLALASSRPKPPVFGFCSSVASAMAFEGRIVPEAVIANPAAATGLGYSQSKWVAEQLCQRANDTTALRGRVAIFRVGQLAGDTKHGAWNTREAWPMMLSAVKVTNSLPDLQDSLDWLPVDVAASSLIQGVNVAPSSHEAAVYHVLNGNNEPTWSEMLQWLKKQESFTIVPPHDWVQQLQAVVDAGSDHPSAQLLDHWKQAYGTSEKTGAEGKSPSPIFAMERTKAVLPPLLDVEPVNEAYFAKLWAWIKANM